MSEKGAEEKTSMSSAKRATCSSSLSIGISCNVPYYLDNARGQLAVGQQSSDIVRCHGPVYFLDLQHDSGINPHYYTWGLIYQALAP